MKELIQFFICKVLSHEKYNIAAGLPRLLVPKTRDDILTEVLNLCDHMTDCVAMVAWRTPFMVMSLHPQILTEVGEQII